MANAAFDVVRDTTPQLSPGLAENAGRPDISSMRAALQVVNAAYYTDDRLNAMTFNDLVAACNGAIPPDITTYVVTPNPANGVAYGGFTFAANGSAPITWRVSTGTLPTGLSLSTAGVLSGTPSGGAGTTNITVRASSQFGYQDVATSITVT